MLPNRISVSSVPASYGYHWITASWTIARRNYKTALLAGLFSFVPMILPYLVGVAGNFLIAAWGPIFQVGFLYLGKDWLEKKDTNIMRFFVAFGDKEIMKKIAPVIAIYLVLAIPQVIYDEFFKPEVQTTLIDPVLYAILTINMVVYSILMFSLPLMLFEDRKFLDTLGPSAKAYGINVLPFLIFGFIFSVILIFTLMALVLPAILFTLPMFVPSTYLIFVTVFEEFDLTYNMAQFEKADQSFQS